ncbi:nucleoside/nucleotide kinase family protein [Arthrobacter sp. zg-Y1171]|uniref:nucleoside/nucleotide kinase family protein n=1 Tax=Arthrobacter sp. zg-Y1171 TaxID=2964610 RepID=UPI0021065757|nr:nucleoside/nucleotide kinase family protein [Arthrobacter sp. zg-Y1171]MCQ1994342.1 nucleoside/nucleotide kinase family protein [Arthrobacter sp. zg-Y1171]UWX81567.1 nucleoside/nucleotide kinase family protein [Arthrobacter sp. zg-Y1171]
MADSRTLLTELENRISALASASAGTVVIGVAGAPGAGKTTLVESLVRELNGAVDDVESQPFAHIPMDGFHLSDRELTRLGLLARKGAPETFDAYGYAALLERLRSARTTVVYAPGFERTLEQPLAGDIPVFPAAKVILTEGNYLLLDRPEWREVRSRCTEVWYCQPYEDQRVQRLVERHVRFGKTPEAAAAWVRDVDGPNARLVQESIHRADVVIRPAWT